ncbi:MAG: pyrroline-5-carboxylate reductase [Bacteroidales bacterium]|nr:pyrroline-5-carboxylate reductase [Bacteroidales bacterium]
MENKKIAIIGAGNIGGAIVSGLLKSNFVSAGDMFVTDRQENVLNEVKKLGVNIAESNYDAVKVSKVIIVAVKPSGLEQVFGEIRGLLNEEKILVSVAAGVGIKELIRMCGSDIHIFRAMPNTAMSLQESLTFISVNSNSDEIRQYVFDLFNKLGKTVEIAEEMMSAATVLSSCGIAFALRYIRASMQGGIEIGFNSELAKFITAQTVKGACELVMQDGHHPETEIDKVTTPRGITITGLNEMEHQGFSSALIEGILSSYDKIENSSK